MTSSDGWTIAMALSQFEEAGVPVDPDRWLLAVTKMARIPRIGELRKPPGSLGGRGHALYPIGQLQLLHKDVAKWIPPKDGHHG